MIPAKKATAPWKYQPFSITALYNNHFPENPDKGGTPDKVMIPINTAMKAKTLYN